MGGSTETLGISSNGTGGKDRSNTSGREEGQECGRANESYEEGFHFITAGRSEMACSAN